MNWKKEWQKPAFRSVQKLWEAYRDKTPSLITIMSYDKNAPPQKLDKFDRIAQDLDSVTRPVSQDEYEDYISEQPYAISVSSLQWWSQDQQRKRWPRLSLMAMDILSIPAMSDEPERVFSGARRTISWERMQFGPESIEKVECLKSWHQSGIMIEELEIARLEIEDKY